MGEAASALNPPLQAGWDAGRDGGETEGVGAALILGERRLPGLGRGRGGAWFHGGRAGVRGVTVSASFHRRHDEPCVDVGARLLTCSALLSLLSSSSLSSPPSLSPPFCSCS